MPCTPLPHAALTRWLNPLVRQGPGPQGDSCWCRYDRCLKTSLHLPFLGRLWGGGRRGWLGPAGTVRTGSTSPGGAAPWTTPATQAQPGNTYTRYFPTLTSEQFISGLSLGLPLEITPSFAKRWFAAQHFFISLPQHAWKKLISFFGDLVNEGNGPLRDCPKLSSRLATWWHWALRGVLTSWGELVVFKAF